MKLRVATAVMSDPKIMEQSIVMIQYFGLSQFLESDVKIVNYSKSLESPAPLISNHCA